MTECIAPGTVEDWELEAYRDGMAEPRVAAHMERCPACRSRVAESRLLEQRLRQTSRTACPDPATLRACYWNELSATDAQAVHEHLSACAHCRAELESLATFISQPATAAGVWEQVKQAAAQARLLVARLLTPHRQPVLTLRGETRQVLLFQADPVAVSVNVEQEETGRYTLFGQVLADPPCSFTDSRVRLTQPGAGPRQTVVDAHGSFAIAGLTPGVYQMIVTLPQQRIVIPMLTLEAG